MKKGLLGSTALIGATALMAGAAGAAEAPTWKLSGNVNFQVYVPDQDITLFQTANGKITDSGTIATADLIQDNALFFGVDESELKLDVSGTADNGLNYGFKIELNANTDDGAAADEARIQLSGGWGTLQLGDEDGASDIMNYGGENLMGATGGFDGDGDDVASSIASFLFPDLTGDTSDSTKISYYSPRFSGVQVGASYTPTRGSGDVTTGDDQVFQQNIEAGANYDNSFGGVRVRASGVFVSASYEGGNAIEDISAFAVGGILGFGPFSVAASYADNGDSGSVVGSGFDDTYWNAAASFETGPAYFSVGYIQRTFEQTGFADFEPSAIAVTADYTVAPGLGVYAEFVAYDGDNATPSIDANVFILGVNVSF